MTSYLPAHAADYQVNGFGNDSSRDCKPKGEVNNTCLLNRDADISGYSPVIQLNRDAGTSGYSPVIRLNWVLLCNLGTYIVK